MRTRQFVIDIGASACKPMPLRSTGALVLALCMFAQPAIAQEQAQSKFLLPILVAALTPVLQTGFGCVFERMFSFLGANPSPACAQPNQTMVIQPGSFVQGPASGQGVQNDMQAAGSGQAQQNYAQGAPAQPTSMNNAQALQLAQTPLFSFIVNKLTDGSPQATVKEAVQFKDVQQGAQYLSFNIKTGESFAILFATTVPGRVRMINTDVDQAVSSSDIYEAMPAADNRMPRDWQGGITMAGKKGVEYLDVDFTPCVSQQYASDPRVVQFQGVLPNCSQESATKRYAPALASGKGGVLASGAKAMIFPASANPGQPVAMAPANYSRGGALTFRLTINHQ